VAEFHGQVGPCGTVFLDVDVSDVEIEGAP
jgi:hypothetical protein